MYGKTITEVGRKQREKIFEIEKQINAIDTKMTLDEWYDKWITVCKKHCRTTTQRTYEIYLGILLHYLLVLAAVLIFGYAFNWVNQLPVYVLAGMCGVVLILCCYLDISRVKADIDEINGLCEKRV